MVTMDANAVDELAQRLAAQAGVVWSALSNHPGYQKFIWREKAREMLAATGARLSDDAEPRQREARGPTFLT